MGTKSQGTNLPLGGQSFGAEIKMRARQFDGNAGARAAIAAASNTISSLLRPGRGPVPTR